MHQTKKMKQRKDKNEIEEKGKNEKENKKTEEKGVAGEIFKILACR
jgi:hypothetical protein